MQDHFADFRPVDTVVFLARQALPSQRSVIITVYRIRIHAIDYGQGRIDKTLELNVLWLRRAVGQAGYIP